MVSLLPDSVNTSTRSPPPDELPGKVRKVPNPVAPSVMLFPDSSKGLEVVVTVEVEDLPGNVKDPEAETSSPPSPALLPELLCKICAVLNKAERSMLVWEPLASVLRTERLSLLSLSAVLSPLVEPVFP
jgi:hypothetical protein